MSGDQDVERAKLAEQAERYDDMAQVISGLPPCSLPPFPFMCEAMSQA